MTGENEWCRRCGGGNVIWFAPSPLWNLVMRENDINGPIQFSDLVCIRCFIVLADEKGVQGVWRLSVDPEPDGLIKVTPSGRVWDDRKNLWTDVAEVSAHTPTPPAVFDESADALFIDKAREAAPPQPGRKGTS